jgi:hypothetical protein
MHRSKLRRQLQRCCFFALRDLRHSARSRSPGKRERSNFRGLSRKAPVDRQCPCSYRGLYKNIILHKSSFATRLARCPPWRGSQCAVRQHRPRIRSRAGSSRRIARGQVPTVRCCCGRGGHSAKT